VSLKYTRTVDVIRNVVERLINAFEFGVDALLEHAKKQKKIETIPRAPRAKSNIIEEIFSSDEKLLKYMKFYIMLRDIRSAPYTRSEEYRRHVTMTSEISPGEFIKVDIDALSEYLKRVQKFLEYITEKLT
jgi:hypothetical protein